MAREHRLKLPVRELLRSPGSTRSIDLELDASDLDVDADDLVGPVTVRLDAESGVDQITVTGTVTLGWAAPCRRCLTSLQGSTEIDVHEVHHDESGLRAMPDDAFPIEHDVIDLRPAVRELVLLELPPDPVCRPDCAGICPVCGVDRNSAPCDCETTVRDERWAVLDELELDD